MSVLRQMQVSVASVGEHVVLAMASSRWTLHYQTALVLSGWMLLAGRAAKRAAGDFSRTWRALGTLHDANHPKGPDAGQPFTPGKVYPVNRDALPLARVGVRNQRTMVQVQLGAETATMPYEAALVIAQWLRLRAKESKARAGDTARHWSKIAAPERAVPN
jgi:hypothetical protein